MRFSRIVVCPVSLLLMAPVLAQHRFMPQVTVRSLAQEPDPGLQFERNVVSGIVFLIGINTRVVCTPWSSRGISVFLEPQSITVESLTKVFRYLSKRYPAEESLHIWVFSDIGKLLGNAREYKSKQAIPWEERFGGHNYFEPPVKMGIDALYTRSGSVEGFSYYPGKSRAPQIDVKLKSSSIDFSFSGDPAIDLVEAAKFGYTDVVRSILNRGVEVNIKTKYGSGALADATCIGQEEVVRLLLERGADVNQTSSSGWTALMCAIFLGRDRILDLLLSHLPDVNVRTEEGVTALEFAVRKNLPGVVRELLARGADPKVEDMYGRTALSFAEKHNRVEIIRLLKEAGAQQ